jgi:hypothetical protein
MSAPNQVSYPTVAQSGVATSVFNVGRASEVGVWIPTITSATISVLVSPDTTDANFVQLNDPRSDVAFAFAATTGSLAVTIPGMAPYTYAKIGFTAAQADVRTIAIIGNVW